LLIQALLEHDVHDALALVAACRSLCRRFKGGKKVPPQLARMGAEDLIASVFPDQLACAENLPGEREISRSPPRQPDDRRLLE